MFFGNAQNAWRIWLIVGLGLCLVGYYQWADIPPELDEAALEEQIDVRYREEIAQMQQRVGQQPLEISAEWKGKFRSAIRTELLRPRAEKLKTAHTILGFGLLLLVVSASLFVLTWLAPRIPKRD
jgi:hypothetical protein